MKYQYIIVIVLLISLTSCTHSKQYNTCEDMTSSLNGVHYKDLVKEWGEPYYKDEYPAGNVFYVKWKGVGVGNKDAKFYFESITYSWGETEPFTVKNIECDPYPDESNITTPTLSPNDPGDSARIADPAKMVMSDSNKLLPSTTIGDSIKNSVKTQLIYDAQDYSNMGFNKSDSNNYKGALMDFNNAIRMNPSYGANYEGRACAEEKLGHYQSAINDYTKLIDMKIDESDSYTRRGNEKYYLHDYQNAILDYDTAITIDPSSSATYSNRANVKSKIGDKNGACNDWNKSYQLGKTEVIDSIQKYCKSKQ